MRVEFCKAIQSCLQENQNSVFLTGDLGFNAFENLQKELGRRFINAGVAEQNMVSLSAGMASAGFEPWIYSITPFLILRALEQIRNDVCFHELPVRLVGNGGGFTYGVNGPSHHALEDISVLKALPNMTLFFPCSGDQVESAVRQQNQISTPSYLRLAVAPWPPTQKPLHENSATLTRQYAHGDQWTIIGVGHAVQHLLKSLEVGNLQHSDLDVFGICKFPFDFESDKTLRKSIDKTRKVLVVEEHYLPGSIAESLALKFAGAVDRFETITPVYNKNHRYGSTKFCLDQAGMSPEKMASRISEFLGKK